MYTNETFEKKFDEILELAADDRERAEIEFARIATAKNVDDGHPFPIFVYHQGSPLWRGMMGVLKYQGKDARFVLVYGKFGGRFEEIWMVIEAP